MRAVSDTSAISNLAIIGRLSLLKERYGTVRIPPAVAQELSALSHSAAKTLIAAAMADGWLLIENTPPAPVSLPFSLDPGETEAIALALSNQADVLLMDEARGRQAARHLGLTVGGVLGSCCTRDKTDCFQVCDLKSTAFALKPASLFPLKSRG